MDMTQFAMVEELASLIKDNLSSKHLVLSTEEALVNFLQSDTSLDGVLELQPMSPYHRLLLHRLADIYGFAHESVGEGDDRHLVLERCPESSTPSILVSDILWQYDEYQPPTSSQHIFTREEAPALRTTKASPPSISLEEREAAYLAARERIFSLHEGDTKEVVAPKSRKVPLAARRMIAHALGQKICSEKLLLQKCEEYEPTNGLSIAEKNEDQVDSTSEATEETVVFPNRKSVLCGRKVNDKPTDKNSSSNGVHCPEKKTHIKPASNNASNSNLYVNGSNGLFVSEKFEREQIGAAKRIFAHALGLPSSKGSHDLTLQCNEGNRAYSRNYRD